MSHWLSRYYKQNPEPVAAREARLIGLQKAWFALKTKLDACKLQRSVESRIGIAQGFTLKFGPLGGMMVAALEGAASSLRNRAEWR